MDDVAEYEGVKEPPEDNDRPWRLVIQPRSAQPSSEQSPTSDQDAAWAELEELFRNQPGAYPGTWRDPDDEDEDA